MVTSKAFSNNDMYFMEVISDKIVINDNYEGVLILDRDFNVIKGIKLLDDLIIETSFINEKEIILYCYENECLIHIDIDSYAYEIIKLNKDLKDKIFLSLYEWINNDLILSADNGMFFVYVNLLDNTAQEIQKDLIDKLQFSIYDNWNKLRKYRLHKIYSDKYYAVIESDNVIMLMDYKNDTKSVLQIETMDVYDNKVPTNCIYHDIEVTTDCVVEISEKKISILYGSKNVILYPNPENYRFLRGKFITIDKTDFLLLLSNNNSNSSKSKIEKYLINKL